MTKHEDTTQAAGGSPLERGVSRQPEVVAVRWIRVDERLPSNDARVLVAYKPAPPGRRTMMFARYAGGQWRLIEDHSGKRLPERVTHWMPCFKLPRGQRQ